jgi:uncharacterized ferritin-like protein (DUF455 family)
MSDDLYATIYQAIAETDPLAKCQLVEVLFAGWSDGELLRLSNGEVLDVDIPGRPQHPELVDPRKVPRRSLATEQGRVVMLHSFAHIEFNAINLALDAAYRFRDMPDDYVSDWLKVAREEAYHFKLVADYLIDLGSSYGAFSAHNGLWDMVCKTRHDVLHRMALVPRVMEARGLDVTPGLMQKFAQIGDQRTVNILQVIYQEEIGHVSIGNRWYHYCCDQRGLNPQDTFVSLIAEYFSGCLRGPFNHAARLEAGFEEDELNQLENCL